MAENTQKCVSAGTMLWTLGKLTTLPTPLGGFERLLRDKEGHGNGGEGAKGNEGEEGPTALVKLKSCAFCIGRKNFCTLDGWVVTCGILKQDSWHLGTQCSVKRQSRSTI